MRIAWLPVCGAALVIAGLVILNLNPPLPPAFGGSFHGNLKELSALADVAGWTAIVAGFALFAATPLLSGLSRRFPATGAPTSPARSRRSPRPGSPGPDAPD